MIDHFNLPVADLTASRSFYEAILEPLGYRCLMQDGAAVGFGRDSWAFGIIEMLPPFPNMHLAFAASSRHEVDEFYRAAIAVGGRDNGPPGLRPVYGHNYYAAFVIDPTGHNVEAVCRSPER